MWFILLFVALPNLPDGDTVTTFTGIPAGLLAMLPIAGLCVAAV